MTASNQNSTDEWLSLNEASERLGVAASTLRRWGDEGRVPMKRTLGGHRRFLASAVVQLQQAEAPQAAPAATDTWGVDARTIAGQDWHTRLASHGNPEHMRSLGQRMLGLLMQYTARRGEDARFLAEARAVGSAYGSQARAAGVSLYDTVEAFLFFRGSFVRPAPPVPGVMQPTDLAEATQRCQRIDGFMNTVLLGLIQGYENPENER